MSSHLHRILNQEVPRDYHTQIPNIVFELLHRGEITIQDFVLYSVLRRIAGENGACWIGQRGLKERTHLGQDTIIESKKNLSRPLDLLNGKPLIQILEGNYKKGEADTITIIDIWPNNHHYFKEKYTCTQNRPPLYLKPTTPIPETDHKKNHIRKTIEEDVLCSSPPEAASEPWEKFEFIDFQGKRFSLCRDDLTTACVMHKKDWTILEIHEMWDNLKKHSMPIRDWFAYCDSVINKKRQLNALKQITGDDKCQQKKKSNNMKQSKPIFEATKQKVSAADMMMQPFANCKFLNGLPIRSMNT